ARERARLHVGITLPVAAMRRQVVLEEGEAHRQRAAVAEGPEAHVDAERETLLAAGVEQPDQQPPLAGEELLAGQRSGPVGLALPRGIKEHQVDVGGEVQLRAAEL